MLFWIAAVNIPKKKKKDEGDQAGKEQLILKPEIVVAKDEKSAAMKVTIEKADVLKKYDYDRIQLFVRPF